MVFKLYKFCLYCRTVTHQQFKSTTVLWNFDTKPVTNVNLSLTVITIGRYVNTNNIRSKEESKTKKYRKIIRKVTKDTTAEISYVLMFLQCHISP